MVYLCENKNERGKGENTGAGGWSTIGESTFFHCISKTQKGVGVESSKETKWALQYDKHLLLHFSLISVFRFIFLYFFSIHLVEFASRKVPRRHPFLEHLNCGVVQMDTRKGCVNQTVLPDTGGAIDCSLWYGKRRIKSLHFKSTLTVL